MVVVVDDDVVVVSNVAANFVVIVVSDDVLAAIYVVVGLIAFKFWTLLTISVDSSCSCCCCCCSFRIVHTAVYAVIVGVVGLLYFRSFHNAKTKTTQILL